MNFLSCVLKNCTAVLSAINRTIRGLFDQKETRKDCFTTMIVCRHIQSIDWRSRLSATTGSDCTSAIHLTYSNVHHGHVGNKDNKCLFFT